MYEFTTTPKAREEEEMEEDEGFVDPHIFHKERRYGRTSVPLFFIPSTNLSHDHHVASQL